MEKITELKVMVYDLMRMLEMKQLETQKLREKIIEVNQQIAQLENSSNQKNSK